MAIREMAWLLTNQSDLMNLVCKALVFRKAPHREEGDYLRPNE